METMYSGNQGCVGIRNGAKSVMVNRAVLRSLDCCSENQRTSSDV